MKKSKTQKGITLIALIITIIVLLILAVVAIGAVQNNGIIEHAKNAKREYQAAQTNEQTTLDNYLAKLNENNPNAVKEQKAYIVGEEVTIGTEKFYVIEDSDKTKTTVKLLAKYCINTTTLKQDIKLDPVEFSTESYWGTGTGTTPYDIEEPEPTLDAETGKLTLPASHKAAKVAYDYGAKLGGTGRLMTYTEFNDLYEIKGEDNTGNKYYNMLHESSTVDAGEMFGYWLGSAENSNSVWLVMGYDLFWVMHSQEQLEILGNTSDVGVRPVVQISKTNIS